MQWWFCLIHQAVEQGSGCPDASRLGPYEQESMAREVLMRMAKRNTDFDDEDHAE